MTTKLWDAWVLDVTLWHDERPVFAWCPIEEDGTIIDGLTIISGVAAPGPMLGIIHAGGQDAVEEWMASHPEVLADLSAANTSALADGRPV